MHKWIQPKHRENEGQIGQKLRNICPTFHLRVHIISRFRKRQNNLSIHPSLAGNILTEGGPPCKVHSWLGETNSAFSTETLVETWADSLACFTRDQLHKKKKSPIALHIPTKIVTTPHFNPRDSSIWQLSSRRHNLEHLCALAKQRTTTVGCSAIAYVAYTTCSTALRCSGAKQWIQ